VIKTLRPAKALGLTIPPSVLLLADLLDQRGRVLARVVVVG
jgi:hypothetical protein